MGAGRWICFLSEMAVDILGLEYLDGVDEAEDKVAIVRSEVACGLNVHGRKHVRGVKLEEMAFSPCSFCGLCMLG